MGKGFEHDIETENPEPIRSQMTMAMRLLVELFPGKNVTFFMAEFGENPERRMYYASNGQRDDMMKALQEYITANQNHG